MRFRGKIRYVAAVVVSVLAVCAVLLVAAFTPSSGPAAAENASSCSYSSSAALAPGTDLQPGVWEFIADTYLAHIAEYPDDNEPVPLLRAYLEGQELIRQGKTGEALALFRRAAAEFPECRHAHAGLGAALWQQYESSQELNDLRCAVQEFIRAAEIGMSYGKVRYTGYLWQGLAQLGDGVTMDDFFRRALQAGDNQYLVLMDYARGLAALADSRAEEWFAKAVAAQPADNVDALAYYAEWLLEQRREVDVLQLIPPDAHIEYLHFLRGVALERLGRLDGARKEYERYLPFTADLPAPAKYRIEGSKVQEGIIFEGNIGPLYIPCDGYDDLALVIECEAAGESEGGQRAVGWTVRTRVMKGELPGCVAPIDNSGPTLSCKYTNVIYQSGQFYTSCGRTPGATPKHVRYDVWYGRAPDPTTGYCASGSYSGNACSGSVHCSGSSQYGASGNGPMRFTSVWWSDPCPTGGQYACLSSHDKTCGSWDGNYDYDHCFYNRP